jgi:sigma-E factor negative regulatory protein RseC
MLDKLGPKNAHVMKIASVEPLSPGQKIELGIAETSLLSSAFLVYMTPLIGLFALAGVFQMLFHSDLAAASGALLGGIGGFIIAKGISNVLGRSASFQPVILSVSLPPDAIRVTTDA